MRDREVSLSTYAKGLCTGALTGPPPAMPLPMGLTGNVYQELVPPPLHFLDHILSHLRS